MAKDLLQETFAKAWEYISRSERVGDKVGETVREEIKNLKAFLYKIMSNLIIDEYRKRKPVDSLEDMSLVGFDPSFDDTDSWVDKLDGSLAFEILNKIPETYRDVIFMRYVQELSLSEIAKVTDENENTIAVRIHRGLAKLREIYNNQGSKKDKIG